tara:strand:+ start:114 stop:593 length:480 start_codon:yes stop_codon:yes gene_type:complete
MGVIVVPADGRPDLPRGKGKGYVSDRVKKIEETADTAAEKKYAKMIQDTKRKGFKKAYKKADERQKGHSRGTRAHTAAADKRFEDLRNTLATAQKDLNLLEDYKSEAPQARSFMTKRKAAKNMKTDVERGLSKQKKAGGGYVKKYAKGGGVRKPKMGVN